MLIFWSTQILPWIQSHLISTKILSRKLIKLNIIIKMRRRCLTSSDQKEVCRCWSRKWCEDVIGVCSEHMTPAAAWSETESQTPERRKEWRNTHQHSWHTSIFIKPSFSLKQFVGWLYLLFYASQSWRDPPVSTKREFIKNKKSVGTGETNTVYMYMN